MPARPRDPTSALIGWVLVAAQLSLVAALIVELRHIRRAPRLRRFVGVVVGASGVATMFTAGAQLGRALHPHPTPTANAVLRTNGLYHHMRHPLYTGLLFWAAGAAVIGGRGRAYAAFGTLAAVLSLKAPYEERQLARRFVAYEEYAQRTPRFIPRWRPAASPPDIEAGPPVGRDDTDP